MMPEVILTEITAIWTVITTSLLSHLQHFCFMFKRSCRGDASNRPTSPIVNYWLLTVLWIMVQVGQDCLVMSCLNDLSFSLSINMSGLQCLASESVWFDKHRFDEAEKRFYEGANGPAPQQQQVEKTIGNFHKIINMLVKQIFILDIYFHVLSLLLLVSEWPVDSRMTHSYWPRR